MAQPTRCPKCAYERKPTDTAPDYECPACGVIYSKYDPSIAERRSAEIELKRSELAAQEEAKKKREIEKAQAKFAREQARMAARAKAEAEKQAPPRIDSALPPRRRTSLATKFVIGLFLLYAIGTTMSPSEQTAAPPAQAPAAPAAAMSAPPRPPSPEEQIAALEKKHADEMVDQAREVCAARIRESAAIPSSVDISWLLRSDVRYHAELETTVANIGFTAKNRFGAEIPYQAICRVNNKGVIQAFTAKVR